MNYIIKASVQNKTLKYIISSRVSKYSFGIHDFGNPLPWRSLLLANSNPQHIGNSLLWLDCKRFWQLSCRYLLSLGCFDETSCHVTFSTGRKEVSPLVQTKGNCILPKIVSVGGVFFSRSFKKTLTLCDILIVAL